MMIIGVLKETKRDERRVALRPDQVKKLAAAGHQVLMESQLGTAAGFQDDQYRDAGAKIAPRDDIYRDSELLAKVKNPLDNELSLLQEGQILFAYLHLDENAPPEYGRSLAETGVSAIAYEWVEHPEGVFPLLAPMSELTGVLFAKRSLELLTRHAGLLGGAYHTAAPPATVLLIGVGTIGANALHYYLTNGLRIILVDKHPETVKERALKFVPSDLWDRTSGLIEQCISFDEQRPDQAIAKINEVLPRIDILINCAVRRPSLPKEMMEHMITREMLARMPQNRVAIDATACVRDFIQTAVPSESLDETYEDVGVVHYNCDHIPSLAAAAATEILTDQTFPYLQLLADQGFRRAIEVDAGLRRGLMVHQRRFYHPYVCNKKGFPLSAWD